jgi:hypothetical protein
MLLDSLEIDLVEFGERTGWDLNERGACKGDVCVPLPEGLLKDGVDIERLAGLLGMPLIHDETHGIWSLGPDSLGRALTSVELPKVRLPDVDGNIFDLEALIGQKILLIAWASW